jgi:hypothetical protein
LFNLYRQAGKAEEARKELEAFQRLKKAREGDPIPEDLEWSWYSEILDEEQPQPNVPLRKPVYSDLPVSYQADPATAQLTLIADGLLVSSRKGVALISRSGAVREIAPAPAFYAAAGDFNNDGVTDYAILHPSGVDLGGKRIDNGSYASALWLDYDHDYDLDLLLLGDKSKLLRNEGDNGFREQPYPFGAGAARSAYLLRVEPDSKALDVAIRYANGSTILYRDQLLGTYKLQVEKIPQDDATLEQDFDEDGRVDLWAIDASGRIVRRRNVATPPENWIRVQLEGVKNPKRALGAEVEIKAGTLYRKRFYTGVPLTFPIGSHASVDTVRITWPNGLIQNETRQPANRAYVYKEAQRLSGSCPHIWTWNGREFQYITDVLGVAPLGASSGDGQYFPTDHDEYIQIPHGALRERGGAYEIRITEELSEVAYLDQVSLIAVDHREGETLLINDKFKAPPFPEFKLFAARSTIRPVRNGNELHFARTHGKSLLVLTGWVDWADGSQFLQAAQTRTGQMVFPMLQGRGPGEPWRTLVEDMGLPAGKPKTIVVELERVPTELRIVTNLNVHWTDIYLTPDNGPPDHAMHTLPLESADLHFRGFSAVTIDPARQQPERFHYEQVSPVSMWNPTPGMYTRFGEVTNLATHLDDRLIIMGSGDELTLRFRSDLLPPKPGYQRDFLLKVDGWAKDRDPNTAYSQTVEPLPHHSMSTYPYPPAEKHPGGAWISEFNTRPALRLMRPLVSQR